MILEIKNNSFYIDQNELKFPLNLNSVSEILGKARILELESNTLYI